MKTLCKKEDHKRFIQRSLKKYWFLYALLLPGVIIVLIYNYLPLLLQLIMSMEEYQLREGVFGSKFVWFQNYKELFTIVPNFGTLIKNTLWISFLRLVFGFFPPLLLSIILFDLRSNRYRKVSQLLIYIPYFFSWVIVYAVAYSMFSYDGLISSLVASFTGEKKNYLMEQGAFLPILIGSSVWKEIGWGTIIYSAALLSIDPELYDAAKIDGCSPFKRIIHVSLPGISYIIIFQLMMGIGNILRNVNSEQILLFYSPATYSVADVIDTWMYRVGLKDFSLYDTGAAISFLQSTFGFVLILAVNKITKKTFGGGLW